MKIIRVMCTGRIDASFILRAFEKGMDGVFIGGCWLGECHYLTEGNHAAVTTMNLTKRLMREIGINPDRLRLESVSASQGIRYAEVVTDFSRQLKELGPLGTEPAASDAGLRQLKLQAAISIVPYLRLVERERLRVRFDTREEYDRFFGTEEVERILKETIVSELQMQEILMLLKEKSPSIEECAETLDLTPAEVTAHLHTAAKRRLTVFDEDKKRFALVGQDGT
jgi:coenzyme F420-reducing hydrogenase delta subunit